MTKSQKCGAVVLLLCATSALAQGTTTFSPPPMVPAGPPPMPPPETNTPPAGLSPNAPVNTQGTPPPPSLVPPNAYQPGGSTGYQYSPYGQPKAVEKPGPEVGLMVSEGLFGMLTAAGIVVLPYFLLFGGAGLLSSGGVGDRTITDVVFIAIFAAVPLAVAQTQVSLANGSRHYFSEMWPAALVGLGGQAIVLGLYYLTLQGKYWPGDPAAGGGSLALLLIGAIGIVPLAQMALINLVKQPKMKFAGINYKAGEGLALGIPMPSPLFAQTTQGLSLGVQIPFINMTF
jgi:hypothetical protein